MNRDTALVLLAAFTAAIYAGAIVALGVTGKVDGAAAVAALAPLGPLAGFAVGRMSGVTGERPEASS